MPSGNEDNIDIKKLSLATIIGVLILGIVVYVAYSYSQKKAGGIALPGGTTYLGQQNPSPQQTPTTPLRFTADSSVSWVTFTGKLFPYSFSHPSTLNLVYFPGDPNDPVGISWNNNDPRSQLLLNMETVTKTDPKYATLPKIEYVKNWYRSFSGLKGISKIDFFTNANGLKGYKAVYINTAGQTPNVNIFFEVPNRPDLMIHLGNGIIDPPIFERITDSVKWNSSK